MSPPKNNNNSSSSSSSPAAIPPTVSDLHCFTETQGVITTTMFDVPGYRIVKVLGAVYGITVRSRNWAAGLGMVLKSVAGGELPWFTSLLYGCRNDAVARVVDEALARGGNAVVALRFDQGDMGGFAQVCAYGTACVVEKIDPLADDHPQLVANAPAAAAAAGGSAGGAGSLVQVG